TKTHRTLADLFGQQKQKLRPLSGRNLIWRPRSEPPFLARGYLFRGVEYPGASAKIGHGRNRSGAVDQARTAQQRREIIDIAVVIEHLAVQLGQKLRETHAFLARNLF